MINGHRGAELARNAGEDTMPKTVLIVDDDPIFRHAMGDGLQAAGYRVVLAADGIKALEQVRAVSPDFILLDLIMPNLDGFRVCKMLKGHNQHRSIPIIVLTGLGREGMKSLHELGAEAAVAKRDVETTLAEVRKMLQLLGSARLRPTPFIDSAQDLAERRIVTELLAERHHTDTVLANLGEGVVELDDGGQVVFMNPAALRILGTTEVEILGTPGANLLGALNLPRLQQTLREVQALGEGPAVSLDLPREGQTVALTLTAVPRPDAPPGALLVLRDLTDHSRRSRNLRALVVAGQRILASLDSATVLREVVTRTAQLLETDRCALFRLERSEAQQQLRCIQAVGLSETYVQALALAPGEGVVWRAVVQRRPVFTRDVLRDPDLRPSPVLRLQLEQEGIGAILATPMAAASEALGALAVYRPAGHRFSSDEAELLTGLAGFAEIAVEHAERLAQVQGSATGLEQRLESPPRSP
jgi:PAS domain S-box-containing protein